MKHSLSYDFYLKWTIRYSIAPILICLFCLGIVIFDPSLWPIYVIGIVIIIIIFLPFILFMFLHLRRAKKAEDDVNVFEGRIIKLEPEMTFTFKSYLKAYVEIHDKGKFIVETYPVLDSKKYENLKDKEVQVSYEKGKKAFILMIL